ncbi:hypothetical protein SDC9_171508 [bioreactor metagenome]|uniref:Uncharacterized protein n=1 Tax=bioreactor metagenome TaxID=1076179 RepID=A0A645GJL7_9ZZZZ
MREAALGADGQRPAQGVEAESRIRTGDQVDAGNRRMGNQVPVHGIAEGFVDAHAVDVDRQSLRGAEQRRGGEAAVVEVGLVGVALDFVDRHGRRLALQLLGDVQALDFLQPAVIQRQDIGRQVQARHPYAGQWRGADDLDGGGGHGLLRPGGREGRRKRDRQQLRLMALSLHVVFLSL